MASTASIFCDGACRGNGTRRAVAGWAWAYWPGVARGEPTATGSARLGGPGPATNQRAELMALLEALRFVKGGHAAHPVKIHTDSQYAINCTSKWGPSWKRKGWKRDSGEPLQNLDLIKPLVDIWAELRVPLVHVRGHQTGSTPEVWGNNWVDRAAVVAAGGGSDGDSSSSSSVMFAATATYDFADATADSIEHIAGGSVVAPPKKVATASATATPATVKQADIRNWFGVR